MFYIKINKWFDFILDMADERIYVARAKLETSNISKIKKIIGEEEPVKGAMRLSRIR